MTAAKRLAKRHDVFVKLIPPTLLAAAWLAGCATVPPPPSLAIWDAAELGRVEVVRRHLAAGTDVNARGGITGLTALHQAAFHGHTAIARLLIGTGADVNAANRRGETPLHSTVYWGHREIAGLLIANGAAVNAKLENGQTPLDWAVQLGAADMAEFFRSQGGKRGVSAKDAEKKQETDFTDLQDHCPTTAHGSRGNRFRRSELDSEAITE